MNLYIVVAVSNPTTPEVLYGLYDVHGKDHYRYADGNIVKFADGDSAKAAAQTLNILIKSQSLVVEKTPCPSAENELTATVEQCWPLFNRLKLLIKLQDNHHEKDIEFTPDLSALINADLISHDNNWYHLTNKGRGLLRQLDMR